LSSSRSHPAYAISYPAIIEYTVEEEARRYTPGIVVQLHASGDDAPCRYIIEVKRRADIFVNAWAWCSMRNGPPRSMRILTALEPLLGNAQRQRGADIHHYHQADHLGR
jgi:hypothetical protein